MLSSLVMDFPCGSVGFKKKNIFFLSYGLGFSSCHVCMWEVDYNES